jgi:hypothetical protein
MHTLAERSLPPLPLQRGLPFDRGHGGSQLLKLCDGHVRLIAWSIENCQFMSSQTAIWQSTPLVFPMGSNSSASGQVASDFNQDGKIDFAMPTPGQSLGLSTFLNATPRATCTPSTISPSVTVCQPQDRNLFEFSGALDCGFAGHQSFGDRDAGLCGQQTGDELSECVAQ